MSVLGEHELFTRSCSVRTNLSSIPWGTRCVGLQQYGVGDPPRGKAKMSSDRCIHTAVVGVAGKDWAEIAFEEMAANQRTAPL